MRLRAPNSSLFPEIDIASKIAPEDGHNPHSLAPAHSVTDLLSPLSSSESQKVRRRLASRRFWVQNLKDYEGRARMVLTVEENGRTGKGFVPKFADMNPSYRTPWGDNVPAFVGGYF